MKFLFHEEGFIGVYIRLFSDATIPLKMWMIVTAPIALLAALISNLTMGMTAYLMVLSLFVAMYFLIIEVILK